MGLKLTVAPEDIDTLRDFDWKEVLARFTASDTQAKREFPALELARAVAVMIFIHKMKKTAVAEQFGRKEPWVDYRMMILYFPSEIQELFDASRDRSERLLPDDAYILSGIQPERWTEAAYSLARSKQNRKRRYENSPKKRKKKPEPPSMQ